MMIHSLNYLFTPQQIWLFSISHPRSSAVIIMLLLFFNSSLATCALKPVTANKWKVIAIGNFFQFHFLIIQLWRRLVEIPPPPPWMAKVETQNSLIKEQLNKWSYLPILHTPFVVFLKLSGVLLFNWSHVQVLFLYRLFFIRQIN